jgi:hypothetical protein
MKHLNALINTKQENSKAISLKRSLGHVSKLSWGVFYVIDFLGV